MEVRDQLHAPAILGPGKNPGSYSVEGCGDPRDILDSS